MWLVLFVSQGSSSSPIPQDFLLDKWKWRWSGSSLTALCQPPSGLLKSVSQRREKTNRQRSLEWKTRRETRMLMSICRMKTNICHIISPFHSQRSLHWRSGDKLNLWNTKCIYICILQTLFITPDVFPHQAPLPKLRQKTQLTAKKVSFIDQSASDQQVRF